MLILNNKTEKAIEFIEQLHFRNRLPESIQAKYDDLIKETKGKTTEAIQQKKQINKFEIDEILKPIS